MTPQNGDEVQRLASEWFSSRLKVQLLAFFHENPGLVETVDGLARRMGVSPDVLRDEIASHLELGILRERALGDTVVLIYDRRRQADIQARFERQLRERLEGDNT